MGKGKDKPIGIRTRVAKDKVIRLTDSDGNWLADLRWRPRGTMHLQIAPAVKTAIIAETDAVPHGQVVPGDS